MIGFDTRIATRALQRIAADWGWPELRRNTVSFFDEARGRRRTIVYYTDGPDDWSLPGAFYLQINQCPIGQQRQFAACVHTEKYRICSGWYVFRLSQRRADRERIADLGELVSKRHFESVAARRAFRKAHPECAGYTNSMLLRPGQPYRIIDAAAGITELVRKP